MVLVGRFGWEVSVTMSLGDASFPNVRRAIRRQCQIHVETTFLQKNICRIAVIIFHHCVRLYGVGISLAHFFLPTSSLWQVGSCYFFDFSSKLPSLMTLTWIWKTKDCSLIQARHPHPGLPRLLHVGTASNLNGSLAKA
jgi:hypothetical protein